MATNSAKRTPKAPWAKVKTDSEIGDVTIHSCVNRAYATQFLADKSGVRPGEMREERDRIGKSIDRAAKAGGLRRRPGGGFLFGELIAWALTKSSFREAVRGQPSIEAVRAQGIPPATKFGFPRGYALPATIGACHTVLKQLYDQLHDAQQAMATVEAERDDVMRQLVAKQEAARVGRVSGLKGGRPPKR